MNENETWPCAQAIREIDEMYGSGKDKTLVAVEEPWTVGKVTVMVKGWRLK